MSTPARVDVPVILSGWTYIGGATLHLVVGLPDTDERLLRASDVADAGDDLDAVLASLGGPGGPAYVGTVPTDAGQRLVARGPVWAQLDGEGDSQVLVPDGGSLDRVVAEVGAGPVRTVRLRVGEPPAPGSTAPGATSSPGAAGAPAGDRSAPAADRGARAADPAAPAVDRFVAGVVPEPSAVPASAGVPQPPATGPRGWLSGDDIPSEAGSSEAGPGEAGPSEDGSAAAVPAEPDVPASGAAVPTGSQDPATGVASPFATLPRWDERAPVLAVPPSARPDQAPASVPLSAPAPEPAPPTPSAAHPAPEPLEHTLHHVEPARTGSAPSPDPGSGASLDPDPPAGAPSAAAGASAGAPSATVPSPVPASSSVTPSDPVTSSAPGGEDPAPDFGLDQLFWGTVQRSEYLRRLEHEEQERAEAELAGEGAAEGAAPEPGTPPTESAEPDVPQHVPAPAPYDAPAPSPTTSPTTAGAPGVVDSPAVRPAPAPAAGGLLISSTPWSRRDDAVPEPAPDPAREPAPAPGASPVRTPATPATPSTPAPPPRPDAAPRPAPAPHPDPAPRTATVASPPPGSHDAPRFYSGASHDPPAAPVAPPTPSAPASSATAAAAPAPATEDWSPHRAAPAPLTTTPAVPAVPAGLDGPDGPDDVDDRTHARSDLLGVPVAGPTVLAVRCPHGHPNPPYASTCRVCGTPVPDQQPVRIARPPLGVLRLSSGDTVTLDRGVLLGRAPRTPDVPAGERPHVVKVASPRKDVSRTHLEVTLDEWQILVRDLQTTNGTTVTLPGQAPVLLRSDEPRLVEPGTRISLADEVEITVEVER